MKDYVMNKCINLVNSINSYSVDTKGVMIISEHDTDKKYRMPKLNKVNPQKNYLKLSSHYKS